MNLHLREAARTLGQFDCAVNGSGLCRGRSAGAVRPFFLDVAVVTARDDMVYSSFAHGPAFLSRVELMVIVTSNR